jgi:transposase
MKKFRPYQPDQLNLLPQNLNEWLPDDHLAAFVSDVVETVLDLGQILEAYEAEQGGQPPYHPFLMVKLLIYGYCIGVVSSRRIEQATYTDVAFRVLAANQHPDHDSIATFRKRHLGALAGLFLQVLKLAQKAGLVKLGHVSVDGSKVRANASKHKAMSYERMLKTEKELKQEISEILKNAQAVDDAEDEKYGKGKRGDELPEELRRRESRLQKIQEAKRALEEEAKQEAEAEAAEKLQRRAEFEKEYEKKIEQGLKDRRGLNNKPKIPNPQEATPEPSKQKNFTDPDSRIMVNGATKSFEQSYNAQIVVDERAQIIVASAVSQDVNDYGQLVPMLEAVQTNMGRKPDVVSADSGYFSAENVTHPGLSEIDLLVAVGRERKQADKDTSSEEQVIQGLTERQKMERKLATEEGKALYKRRKAIVEPVFGQIKEARKFRRFSFRGLEKVQAEWDFVCLTHNLLKIFRSGFAFA